MSNQNEHSDQLFERLEKEKKMRRRRIVRTVLIVIVAVIILGIMAVSSLRKKVEERFGSFDAEVLAYEVKTGTINTVVSGSGTLTEDDLEQVKVPAGVEIMEIIPERNDAVGKGDVLATVDMASVMTALAEIQTELDELDEQIADAKGDEVSRYVKAGIPGRVKILYAQKDMDVTSCMAENGALAVLSLDGYMAVDIETDALSKGDTIMVIRGDGQEISGTVDSVFQGIATVLVTDNGPEYGESVTVNAEDGNELGKGNLYIHSPLAITGYAGTISNVSVSENTKVYASTSLFPLKDPSFSANYDTVLRTRGEKEEVLLKLLMIYRDGAVLAPMDGVISSVDYEDKSDAVQAAYPVSQEEETETALLTLYPDISMSITIGIGETDILSLEVGQEAEVVVSSVGEDVVTGTVTEISKEASTSARVTQYSAVITLPKAEGMLPGMTADVDIKIKGVENALIIPVDALHQTSAISFVYTSYDPETWQYGGMVEVTTGMQNDKYVEILTGLKAGDTVYYTETQDFFSFFMGMSGMQPAYGDGMPGGMDGSDFGGGHPDMGGPRQGG